jgi:hypothetical protein
LDRSSQVLTPCSVSFWQSSNGLMTFCSVVSTSCKSVTNCSPRSFQGVSFKSLKCCWRTSLVCDALSLVSEPPSPSPSSWPPAAAARIQLHVLSSCHSASGRLRCRSMAEPDYALCILNTSPLAIIFPQSLVLVFSFF